MSSTLPVFEWNEVSRSIMNRSAKRHIPGWCEVAGKQCRA